MFARFIASVLLLTLLAAARAASAQDQPEDQAPPVPVRVNRGLFGGNEEPAPGLSMLLTSGSGYDTNVLSGQQGGGGGPLSQGQVAGSFGDASGRLRYFHLGNRIVFHALGSSNLRYYPGLDVPTSYAHTASFELQFPIGRRWHFDARQGAQYASFNRIVFTPLGPAPESLPLPEAPPVDSGILSRNNLSYDSEFSARQTLSSRSSLNYYAMRSRTETGFERRPLVVLGGGAGYQRRMTRYGTLLLGYGYTRADYHRQPPDIMRMHMIDSGYQYERPLSFLRRTTVSVSTGAQAFERRSAMVYRALVNGNIERQIGRTWALTGSYNRSAQFVAVVGEPVYADTVGVRLGGLLGGRRLAYIADAGYSNGQLTYTLTQNRVVTYAAGSSLQWAISERWSLGGTYGYHKYELGENVPRPPGLASEIGRHSVRVGVNFWLPLTTERGASGPR